MSLRDLLGPPSVPDPAAHTGPAVVEDAHAEHPHRRPPGIDEFTAPPQDAPVQQQHGGPGAARAVPVLLSGTAAVKPHPAARWACGVVAVPDAAGGAQTLVQVLGRDLYRRGVTLTNTGAQTVWVAPSREQCQIGACFPIAAGAAFTLDAAAPVWATSTAGGGGSTLAWATTGEAADQ